MGHVIRRGCGHGTQCSNDQKAADPVVGRVKTRWRLSAAMRLVVCSNGHHTKHTRSGECQQYVNAGARSRGRNGQVTLPARSPHSVPSRLWLGREGVKRPRRRIREAPAVQVHSRRSGGYPRGVAVTTPLHHGGVLPGGLFEKSTVGASRDAGLVTSKYSRGFAPVIFAVSAAGNLRMYVLYCPAISL